MSALLIWQWVHVEGYSMSPGVMPGDRLLVRHDARITPGSIVLGRFRSRPYLAVVKRADHQVGDGWYLVSDNPRQGSDSRQYGPADVDAVAVWWCPVGPRPPGTSVSVLGRFGARLGQRPPAAPPPDL